MNWVRTYILPISEFRQLDMGISTNLYLPAIGTAGLLLVEVSGESLEPAPPPNITATTLFIIALCFDQFSKNFGKDSHNHLHFWSS